MKKLSIIMAMLFLFPALGYSKEKSDMAEVEQEAKGAFVQIVNLWYDKEFEELYVHIKGKKLSKEKFREKMEKKEFRLKCCFEKLEIKNVKGYAKNAVDIDATLGFENKAGKSKKASKSFRIVLDGGIWKIGASDVLSLP